MLQQGKVLLEDGRALLTCVRVLRGQRAGVTATTGVAVASADIGVGPKGRWVTVIERRLGKGGIRAGVRRGRPGQVLRWRMQRQ